MCRDYAGGESCRCEAIRRRATLNCVWMTSPRRARLVQGQAALPSYAILRVGLRSPRHQAAADNYHRWSQLCSATWQTMPPQATRRRTMVMKARGWRR